MHIFPDSCGEPICVTVVMCFALDGVLEPREETNFLSVDLAGETINPIVRDAATNDCRENLRYVLT